MRRVIQTLAVLALAGALGAAAVVGLGLYNVSAQKGHWPGVGWVLHTTFRNGVKLRAPDPSEVPDLGDPAMIELGARHYASACAPCHAAPGSERSATMQAMLPAPPHIEAAVRHWQAHELHWIVANGIKMSGMPAWLAEGRADEVWPVVAYLMRVKEGLDAPGQAELTAMDTADGPEGAAYCAGCHEAVGGAVPRLDIQTPEYLSEAVSDYLDGRRASGVMQHAVTAVPRDALPSIVTYLAAMPVERPAIPAGSAEGEALATRGDDDVPACAACHDPEGRERKPGTPALAGQEARFLADQLRLWRDGRRSGSELMEKAAMDLTDEDIDHLSAYFASLEGRPGPAGDR